MPSRKDETVNNSIDTQEEEYSDDDSCMRIYPSLGAHHYTPQDLIDFSTRAITKYNQKKGSSYMFVELVEGKMLLGDTVITEYKAQETNGVIKTFRASATTTVRRASAKTTYALSDPNLRIRITRVPDSGILIVSSDSGSDSDSDSGSE